jgi:saccharopine dehydrogenase-like NADP-dependent oxidoreductase
MVKNYDFVVLGAEGMQGKIVARDLLENDYSVLMCGWFDTDKRRVQHLIDKYYGTGFDYSDARNVKRITKIVKRSGADVVVNCVEGNWDLHVLRACIKAGVHCIDLGSDIPMTKIQLGMHERLKRKGLIHITGAGSVPGIGNVMLRYAGHKFDRISTIEAGFAWDSNINKFVPPFSIESIAEEFVDPAPYLEGGKFKKKSPLDTVKREFHKTIGFQKQFLVRHPETYTFYHYYKWKGVKNIRFWAGFPKHSFDTICTIIELGMAKKDNLLFRHSKLKPIDFTTELLKDLDAPGGYKEKENLWVWIEGKHNGRHREILMECLANTTKGWEDSGCNVDTGRPAAIMAQMVKEGVIKKPGSYAPEGIVPPNKFFEELRKRGMVVLENGEPIN